MSRLKDEMIEAQGFAEQVINDGCEDFAEFSQKMKELRESRNNILIHDERYLEDLWDEVRGMDWSNHVNIP
tara:strand:- start:780 stop:992 length:213 start_codon:yes stop_codon:yes gene_type:complete